MTTRCVFCRKIDAGRDRHGTVQRLPGWSVATFEPIGPVTPGHRLFVPIRHVEHGDGRVAAFDLAEAVASAEGWAVAEGWDAWNIITSAGAAATQTVAHMHVHLVPRREGDGLALPWTGQDTRAGC